MSFAIRTASSSVEKRAIPATGPKVSSQLIAIVGGDAGEHGRLEELPLDARRRRRRPRHPRSTRIRDVPLDLLDAGSSISGPTLTPSVNPSADLEPAHGRREAREELVVDAVLHEHPVRRDAGLAGVAELAR